MVEAFVWGAIGASALLVGSLIAYQLSPSRQVIAVTMALGSGLLIGSVSFELIDEALKTRTVAMVGLFVLVGAAVFTVGDWLFSTQGGRRAQGPQRRPGRWVAARDRARLDAPCGLISAPLAHSSPTSINDAPPVAVRLAG